MTVSVTAEQILQGIFMRIGLCQLMILTEVLNLFVWMFICEVRITNTEIHIQKDVNIKPGKIRK